MNIQDIVVLLIIVALLIPAVISIVKNKGKCKCSGCTGCCAGCCGCDKSEIKNK
ncbi:MAG: hypothetical protein MJ168_02695 [Clostridia bacterium]|nr:hypothetical protein [Clostridia bacterium]